VLLNEDQDLAGHAGWAIVQEDAQSAGDLSQRVARRLVRGFLRPPRRRPRGASVTAPVGGAALEFGDVEDDELVLRDVPAAVLDRAGAPEGALATVDEIPTADRGQLSRFGSAIQHLIRQDRHVAAVVAGLPVVVDDDLATFFSRCAMPQLGSLPPDAVRLGLQRTAALGGGGFIGRVLDLAVSLSAGCPYMVQLVGYRSWECSGDGSISEKDVHLALGRCELELAEAITGLRHVRSRRWNAAVSRRCLAMTDRVPRAMWLAGSARPRSSQTCCERG
jgi:hypothetical protein